MGIAARHLSVFRDHDLPKVVGALVSEIRDLYRDGRSPWVVGYSGGKDSTATLSLVWLALAGLDPAERTRAVHVISTDTLVENPIVAFWVARSLDAMRAAAERAALPIHAHRLTPAPADTFWVNLIGRGYAAPRPKFRWCTDRLKIRPSNAFINRLARDASRDVSRGVSHEEGEVILVLGTRRAESRARARSMQRHAARRTRDRLSPNASLSGSLVYTPIESWSNDDVWMFLMQVKNPWGHDNKALLAMYQGASPDGECPLVVDTSTPSCGDSRFGCWVCTMVSQDKSMAAMIRNDADKEWMLPLLELRNDLDARDDRHLREHRRMNGKLMLHRGRLVHGPYTQAAREHWLTRLLEAQKHVRERGPEEMRDIQLITLGELSEIRRIWVIDKHELEDNLPRIYEAVLGEPYPGPPLDDGPRFGAEEMAILRAACDGDEHGFQMARALLGVKRHHRSSPRRAGLSETLSKAIEQRCFRSEEEARAWALSRLAP